MTQIEIEQFIEGLEGVERDENMGYVFYYVGDWHMIPFVSIAESGNEYEKESRLEREGVFRVNIGVSKKTFDSLFSGVDLAKTDFSILDTFLPHPHYSKQFFICILNPSEKNAEQMEDYILEAHAQAKRQSELRKRSQKKTVKNTNHLINSSSRRMFSTPSQTTGR